MILSALLGLAAVLHASSLVGYVVKVDSRTVYLDLGVSSGVAAGQDFVVFSQGEELKHPVSGVSLGRIEKTVSRGRITEVAPAYSTGLLQADAEGVAAGQRVRIEGVSAPEPAAPSEPSHPPEWRSPVIDIAARDLAVADVDGDGKPELVVGGKSRVLAFPADDGRPWAEICSFDSQATGFELLSLEAADLDGDGKAEVFATYHNEFFNRVETAVLQCGGGKFQTSATLPWMVRSYPDATGTWRLAAQALLQDKSFPFGGIFPLEHRKGRYALGAPPVRRKRLEWLYGFAMAETPEDGEPIHLAFMDSGSIRIQFVKKTWSSPESYGQTSSRVRWYDRLLKFYPRLAPKRSQQGFYGVYALRNIPKLGALADAFGVYGQSELHRLRWNQLALEPEWKAVLTGYAADLAVYPADAKASSIFVAVVGSTGKTSVWKFPF